MNMAKMYRCLFLALLVAGPLAAQPTELIIRDNTVYFNGKAVANQDLPPGLDLSGIDLTYRIDGFPTGDPPLIRINEKWYVVTPDGIAPAPDAPSALIVFKEDDIEGLEMRVGPEHEAVKMQLQALVSDMQETTASLQPFLASEAVELVQATQAAGAQVSQAAQMLEQFSNMEVMQYFHDVQSVDSILYGSLLEEWAMERKARALAAEARALSRRGDRRRMIAELREQLEDIFELKQENRRLELQQMTLRIEELAERLRERDAARKAIIERRLQELLGAAQ